MARLVIGLGTSHSPMLVTDASLWEERAISDHTNPELYDVDGNHRTYDELLRSGKTSKRKPSAAFGKKRSMDRNHLHRFGMPCRPPADRFVLRGVGAAPGIAGRNLCHAHDVLEDGVDAPEASARKNGGLAMCGRSLRLRLQLSIRNAREILLACGQSDAKCQYQN